MTDTHPYSLRQIEQMLGLTRRVIANLIAAGFVTPNRGPRNAYRFSFQDVVLLRTAHQLREANIPPRRLLRSLKQLRAKLPDQMPLSGLRIKVIGNDVAVRDADAQWEAPGGQLVMDFEWTAPSGPNVHLGKFVGGATSGASTTMPGEAIAPEGAPTNEMLPSASSPSSSSVGAASAAISSHGTRTESAAEAAPTNDMLSPASSPSSSSVGAASAAISLHGTRTDSAAKAAPTNTKKINAARYDQALQQESSGHPADAARTYRQILATDPAHTDAAINLSALLCEAGHCAQALAICDQAIAAGSEHTALLHFNRAIALEDLRGREDDAQLAYQRCLQLDPSLADAHYNLARLHEKRGRKQAALRHFSAYRRLQR